MWRRIFKSHLRHSFFLLTLFNVIKTKKEKSLMSHLFVLDIKTSAFSRKTEHLSALSGNRQ